MPTYLSPQWMLLYSLGLTLLFPQLYQFKKVAKKFSKILLQLSIVLLGSSLNISEVIHHGSQGFFITLATLSSIFGFSFIAKKLFSIDSNQSILITAGTAICGGSAIAAIAPIIHASGAQMAISMGVVFLLNALAIFIFPPIGHLLDMTQSQFGLFSALAIHDTSSVVAASSIYGTEALKLATTYKLTRALWIIPLSVYFSIRQNKDQKIVWYKKVKVPSFIIGFILVSLLFSTFKELAPLRYYFSISSKLGLSFTLFLIGFTIEISQLKQSGQRSLLFGCLLWMFTILISFGIIQIF